MAATTSEMALVVRARNAASKTLRTVGRDLDTLNAKSGRTGRAFAAMKKIAVTSIVAIGVAVGAVVAKSITAWASFDDKMTQSLAIMGDISKQTRDEMELVARDVAKSTRFSAEQAAEAYFFLASAGLDAEQSMAAMPQVAAFAQAGMFDLARATDLATDAQSALGLTVPDSMQNLENMTRVTDVLVKANTLANASVEQFSESLTNKAGAALRLANKDIEEGVAVLAVFADQGFKGQVAGDMFSRVLKGLQINALKNADAFEEFGIQVYDSDGNMRNMADITEQLTGAFDGLSDAQKTQALLDLGFSARQQDVIKTLIGSEDKMRAYEAALREAGGTTQEVADKQLQSLSAQFDILKSLITDVFIGLGKELAPAFESLVKALQGWVQTTLPKVIAWFKRMWTILSRVAKVIYDVLIRALRRVIRWWEELSPGLKDAIKFGAKFAAVAVAIGAGLALLAGFFAALASPILLIIGALFALGAALKYAWDNWEWLRDTVNGWIEWFKTIDWEAIWATIQEGWDTVVAEWDSFWDGLKEPFENFKEDFLIGWDYLFGDFQVSWNDFTSVFSMLWSGFWSSVGEVAGNLWDLMVKAWNAFWENLNKAVDIYGGTISGAWGTIWSGIVDVFGGTWQTIRGIWDVFAGFFEGDWSRVWEGIKEIFAGQWRALVGLAKILWGAFKGAWGIFWNSLVWLFGDIVGKIVNVYRERWELFKSTVSGLWNTFYGFWRGKWDLVWQTVSNALGKLGGIFRERWEQFKTVASGLFNAWKSTIGQFWLGIGTFIVDKLVSGIGGMANAVKSAAGGAAKGFVNAFIGMWNRLDPRVKLPSMTIFGKTFGGQQSPDLLPDLPYLKDGGRAVTAGLAVVGEKGAEVVSLRSGQSVHPLTGNAADPIGMQGGGNTYNLHLHDVDLSEGARKTLLRIREGLRQLEKETA